MRPSTLWTDIEVAHAKRRWNDGVSSGVIADELGKSRNSVIGKISRLRQSGASMRIRPPAITRPLSRPPWNLGKTGLARSESPHRVFAPRAAKVKPMRSPARPSPVPVKKPTNKPVTFLAVGSSQCRFPMSGDPGPAMLVCGAPTELDCSWCEYHSNGRHSQRVWAIEQPRARA